MRRESRVPARAMRVCPARATGKMHLTPRVLRSCPARFSNAFSATSPTTRSRAREPRTYPSTPGQLVLLRDLVAELKAMGVADAAMDEHGYVMATIPATTTKADVPVDRLHRPRRHLAGDERRGRQADRPSRTTTAATWCCPTIPTAVLRVADIALSRRVPRPRHRHRVGHDAARRRQQERRRRDHDGGRMPDRRIRRFRTARSASPSRRTRRSGTGTKHFDVARFGARYAYTMDGGPRGELEIESFSADAMTLTFRGFNTHPGFAKGRMVNAIKLAARFIERLPADRLSPETTDGREGFVHPYVVQAGVDRTTVKLHRPRLRHRRPAGEGGVARAAGRARWWPACRARRSR